ncbi:VapE domain-containing protein [Siphonobacter sp. SORGH_AS_1065]|uniref:VapE domain-containing protein n=1 Tax=Siphonobacter sp. SORGH_AS_1065 TaxID=3041795 RepID=UPI002782B355|nr:VapE domain-containing protein [Siphonobacter sp. SORGH_AS_1065]MDQ1085685.1 putative P-loop ATPase [Siphonobacter sp. SORGH_AS_1065]
MAKERSTSENAPKITRIQHFIFNRFDLRYNVIANELLSRPKGSQGSFEMIDKNELNYLLFEAGFSKFSSELDTIMAVKVPKFDPIKHYFEHLPAWDGFTDHINYLSSFVETDDNAFFQAMFKKHLVRMVRQGLAQESSFFNKHCLTFVGRQNDGKTSFFDFLVPPSLFNYKRKGLDFGKKDGLISLVQNFLINLDELASFDKKELNNEFKTVLSESAVKFRALYDKNERPHTRRASFVASTNQTEFLTDETGNVRWLVFQVKNIRHDQGGKRGYSYLVDIDLVWSQAYALWKDRFADQLDPDELKTLERRNANFLRVSHEMELVRTHFVPAVKGEANAVFWQTTKLMNELNSLTTLNLRAEMIGRALTALHYPRSKDFGVYGYWLKRLATL